VYKNRKWLVSFQNTSEFPLFGRQTKQLSRDWPLWVWCGLITQVSPSDLHPVPMQDLAAVIYITHPQTSFKTARERTAFTASYRRFYSFWKGCLCREFVSKPFHSLNKNRLIRRNARVTKNETLTSPLKYCTHKWRQCYQLEYRKWNMIHAELPKLLLGFEVSC
jgi:hypothetical protein